MNNNNKMVVIGGGLVGSLQAAMLALKEIDVTIFDSRPDPRALQLEDGKSINLALSTRGIHSLDFIGIRDTVINEAIPMKGRYIHNLDGSTYIVPYSPHCDCIYSVNRKRLNEQLLTRAENLGVKMHFNHKLTSVDFSANTLHFEKIDTNNVKIQINYPHYDYLFGCDGVHSTVRRDMMRKMRSFSQEYLPHQYKELEIPPVPEGGFAIEKNYLHIWPRNEYMMIALANPDGSFTLTLFMPDNMFTQIQSNQNLMDFFRLNFPDAIALIGEDKLKNDYFNSPIGSLLTIKCTPYYFCNALLLGDAAHAMVPFYGQGMNAGFEDCYLFQLILQDKLDNMKEAMIAYSDQRYENAVAICDLALSNYVEMRKHVNSKIFLFTRKIHFVLAKLFPTRFIPLYQMVAFTRRPYSSVIAVNRRQDSIVNSIIILSLFAISLSALALLAMIKFRKTKPPSHTDQLIGILSSTWKWLVGK